MEDDYAYLPIEDARKAIGQKVNLFGVIARIGTPRKIKGRDYVLYLKLVDPSYQFPGLSVNFFSDITSKLPDINSSGDLICLHAVKIYLHNGELYCAFKKHASSFAIYKRGIGEDMTPYQTSTNFNGLPQDHMFLERLREWVLNQDSGTKTYELELRAIKLGQVFDLICKVLYISGDIYNGWTLFLWDGTDAPPANFPSSDGGGEKEPPLHAEIYSLPRNVLCSFPTVGTVLVATSKTSFEGIPQLPGGHRWVRVCNLVCELHDGIWKGVLQRTAKILLLYEGDKNILIRERFYSRRTSMEGALAYERRPITSFPWVSEITETDDDVKDVTLMDSLTCPEVIHKFKCVARVVGACPWNPEDGWCRKEDRYLVKLVLEDPTARVHAYLYKEDAVKFFGGYPPTAEVVVKWYKLLGISEHEHTSRNPPWAFFCIMSFYVDEKDPWGSRKYRIFGTKLVT